MRAKPLVALLSHMRSYSSVLAHILGSHPAICGYSELHCETLTPRGLLAVRHILSQRDDYSMASYLLDKLLHNGAVEPEQIEPELIETGQIIPLVTFRQPESTLKSIIHMGRHYCRDAQLQLRLTNVELVTQYYVQRLNWLERFLDRFGERSLLLRAEELLSDPLSIFARIEKLLGLNSPLSTYYRVFANTGLPGHGDPSPWIRHGTLLRQQDVVSAGASYDEIEIPKSLLIDATQVYEPLLGRCTATS